MRSCGSCTKCCDGHLGVPYPSETKACLNVVDGGCAIYSIRPDFPCKSFKCGWLRDESMPEELKPDKSNIILYPEEVDGIAYLAVVGAGESRENTKSLLIEYSISNNINIEWNNSRIGSHEFLKANMANRVDKAHID